MTKLFLAAGVAALAIAAPAAADNGKRGDKGRGKDRIAKVERGGGDRDKRWDRKDGRRGGERVVAARAKERDKWERKPFKEERKALKADRREFLRDGDDRGNRRVARIRDFDDDDRFDRREARLRHTLLPAAFRERRLPIRLRNIYRDDDDYYYRYGDGYLYRVDRKTNLVASLLPLLGAGLSTGQLFPAAFGNYYVPQPYRAFYRDGPDDYYRYANGYVYEIDRDTGMIESMVPLMAGGYGMGQMLPASYSVYNVPYQYRTYYADTEDYMYRYAPGAIYQVDPGTRLITAVASLLTGNGLSVGQPLPVGYSAYNVPLAYRDQYYDTPDAWYRYNNGNIYRVDPTTQLVTSIIRAIV